MAFTKAIIPVTSIIITTMTIFSPPSFAMKNNDNPLSTYQWGNTTYVDFAVGDSYIFQGKKVTLVALDANYAIVNVGDTEKRLIKVVRALPTVMEGVRVFVADTRITKELTTDPEVHGLLQKDALIALSDASKPLLDPDQYTFPVGRIDGYNWHMEESSGMFSYYGEPWRAREGMDYFRSHEGIDFDIHEGRGVEKHPLVAMEDGTIVLAMDTNDDEACIIMASASNPNVYYVYQHMNNRLYFVEEGQKVKKGDKLGYIWGDGVWGHLHLSVVYRDEVPGYRGRYTNTFNFFPQMYELWHGDLELRSKVWENEHFTFIQEKSEVGNKLRFAAYDEIVGYGWRIGDWCTAAAMQRHPRHSGSMAFKKTLHKGHPAEAVNPEDHYDFEVAVKTGNYKVRVKVGDVLHPTWQKISVNGVPAGTIELEKDQFEWTEEVTAEAPDGHLTVRFHLKDEKTHAGVSALKFTRETEH